MDLTKLPECSELEAKNAVKIAEFLSEIDDISYKKLREDIFEVTSAGITCIVDVEDTIACLAVDVCYLPDQGTADLLLKLMRLNTEAVHGKFCLSGNKILMKDNLEIENIDKNEFEASLSWLFAMVRTNINDIANILSDEEYDAEEEGMDDMDDMADDLEDIIIPGPTEVIENEEEEEEKVKTLEESVAGYSGDASDNSGFDSGSDSSDD